MNWSEAEQASRDEIAAIEAPSQKAEIAAAVDFCASTSPYPKPEEAEKDFFAQS